jgi:hypothetical protein
MKSDRDKSVNVGSRVYQRTRLALVSIGGFHILMGLAAGAVLYWFNVVESGREGEPSTLEVIINSSLIGFVGSLLYFSRKVYAYLITDRFGRLIKLRASTVEDTENGAGTMDVETFNTIAMGYYIYLSTRPLAGLAIGPIMMFLVRGGLITFGDSAGGETVELSVAGGYLVYVAAFVGGYSSSDLFDYFSNFGGRLMKRIDIP